MATNKEDEEESARIPGYAILILVVAVTLVICFILFMVINSGRIAAGQKRAKKEKYNDVNAAIAQRRIVLSAGGIGEYQTSPSLASVPPMAFE